jgi:hypothetical protein
MSTECSTYLEAANSDPSTGAAADNIQNGASNADLRWGRYLQQCSLTNTSHLHLDFGGNVNPPTYAGPSGHYGRQQQSSPFNRYPVFLAPSPRTIKETFWFIMLIPAFLPL